MITLIEGHPVLKTALGLTTLFLGLACLAFATANFVVDGSLWLLGRKTAATVVEAWTEPIGTEKRGELSFKCLIRYQFTTTSGHTITGTSTVGPGEWSSL